MGATTKSPDHALTRTRARPPHHTHTLTRTRARARPPTNNTTRGTHVRSTSFHLCVLSPLAPRPSPPVLTLVLINACPASLHESGQSAADPCWPLVDGFGSRSRTSSAWGARATRAASVRPHARTQLARPIEAVHKTSSSTVLKPPLARRHTRVLGARHGARRRYQGQGTRRHRGCCHRGCGGGGDDARTGC